MKKIIANIQYVFFLAVLCSAANAQNTFPSTGRAGVYTTSPAATLQVKGGARIGTTANYVNIDSATGNLSFTGTATYRVANNQYAFQNSANPGIGLYFNATNARYEFRNSASAPTFYVGATTGNGVFIGNLKVGAYTLPATDGTNGQLLKTNGTGTLTWSNDNTSAGGWSLIGNAGTSPSTNFIGTTDEQPLVFKVNNLRAGYIDYDSLKANTSFGHQSFGANTSGIYNTAVGFRSLFSNTQGNQNTALGYSALYHNTTGYSNTGVGYQALFTNVSSIGNTATGLWALYSTTSSIDNTANGIQALYHNTSGGNNTACGGGALITNTTGFSNSGFGFQALFTNSTGSDNTALGQSADVSADGFEYATALGDLAIANASYKVVVGPNIGGMVVGGYAPWSNLSDGRFKENVKEDVPGLKFITKLRPITYTVNTKKLDAHVMQNMPDSIRAKRMQRPDQYAKAATKIQTGFIAQEVEKTAKEMGYDFDGVNAPKNNTDNYSIAYSQFVVPLVKAVQELSAKNDNLQKQIDDLKAMIVSNQSSAINQQSAIISSALLEQNIPNPFANTTTISYTLPQKFERAQIIITDKNGKTIKAVNISGNGKGSLNIDAVTLSSGAYNYSLIVDGKLIASKQMVLAR